MGKPWPNLGLGPRWERRERGQKKISAPRSAERLFPGDKIYIIGTDEQNLLAQNLIEAKDVEASTPPAKDNYALEPVFLKEESPYINKSIRECGIREKVDGLIVGIERNNQRFLNPEASFVLASGDLLWIVGEREKIQEIKD